MNLTGTWTGKLMDKQGFSGDLELRLEHSDDRFEGQVALKVFDEESTDLFSALVKGGLTDGTVTLAYESGSATQPQLNFMFRGQLADAKPHARYCMYGSYEIEGGRNATYLGGGCCLFWLYRM